MSSDVWSKVFDKTAILMQLRYSQNLTKTAKKNHLKIISFQTENFFNETIINICEYLSYQK